MNSMVSKVRSLIWVIVGLSMLAAMLYLRHNDPNSPYLPALKWFWIPITFWGIVLWYINRKSKNKL
jgi:hypothetical protein